MADDRRTDPTWTAIRQNWPLLIVVAVGLMTWGQMVYTVQQLKSDLSALQDRLSLKVVTEFAKWQVNVERDIQELRKQK